MHRDIETYGAAAHKWAPMVLAMMAELQPRTMLDYGAGKCALRAALGSALDRVALTEYDPGVKRLAKRPVITFDLVCCIDVLEHVEPDCLRAVLADLRDLAHGGVLLATIHTGPAGKHLSDGRNAHLTQQGLGWWLYELAIAGLEPYDFGSVGPTLWISCRPG